MLGTAAFCFEGGGAVFEGGGRGAVRVVMIDSGAMRERSEG
jgi:hypothetical protein